MPAGGGEADDHRDPDRDRVHRLGALEPTPPTGWTFGTPIYDPSAER